MAIASRDRKADSSIPTLREQGVDVVTSNWRAVFALPALKARILKENQPLLDAVVEVARDSPPLVVGRVEILPDRALQFARAPVRAARQLALREEAEPPLDLIEPRALRRREVQVIAGRLPSQRCTAAVLWVA